MVAKGDQSVGLHSWWHRHERDVFENVSNVPVWVTPAYVPRKPVCVSEYDPAVVDRACEVDDLEKLRRGFQRSVAFRNRVVLIFDVWLYEVVHELYCDCLADRYKNSRCKHNPKVT